MLLLQTGGDMNFFKPVSLTYETFQLQEHCIYKTFFKQIMLLNSTQKLMYSQGKSMRIHGPNYHSFKRASFPVLAIKTAQPNSNVGTLEARDQRLCIYRYTYASLFT